MSVIGIFKPSKEGGWEGNLRTLGINERLRLVPNDDRSSDDAPAFRVMLGRQRIGDAWEACTQDGKERDYLRLRLDDTGFARPMTAALFPDAAGETARLMWRRGRGRPMNQASGHILTVAERARPPQAPPHHP